MIYLVGYKKEKRDRGGGMVKAVSYMDVKGVCQTAEDAEIFRQMLEDGEFEMEAVVEAVPTRAGEAFGDDPAE